MEKIRFGLYGYGKVAQLHATALASLKNAELVAVCGRNLQKAHDFAERWKITARSSCDEMAQKDTVNAVLITTPHPLHAEHAKEALRAGCHVIVEKPMALRVQDCDDMIALAKDRNLTVSVISQRRLYPATLRIKEAIDAGLLGTPMLGQVTMLGWRDKAYYESDPWRGSWSMEGGGVLVNQAPHQLDLLSWYLGSVKEVAGFWTNVNHPYIEVDDSATAVVRFKSGALASIFVSNSQEPGIHAKVQIHGSSGASAGVQTDGGAMFIAGRSGVLEPPVNDLWTIPGQQHLLEQWKQEDSKFFSTIDATWYFFARQLEDFSNAIIQGTQPMVSAEEGREAVKIIEGIYRSQESGSIIRF